MVISLRSKKGTKKCYNNSNNQYKSKKKGLNKEQVDVLEVAPPSAKSERMVKHIKKAYSKDGKLTDREKSIAYATAWKHHNGDK